MRVACTCDDTTWLDEEAKRAVESVSVDGDTVVLTLVSAAASEDVVVVSYTPPSRTLPPPRPGTWRATRRQGSIPPRSSTTPMRPQNQKRTASQEETTEGETPLTVSLEATTESHNGTDAFTFEIRFSEEFPLSYKTLRDLAFTVSGGGVKSSRPNGWTSPATSDG